MFRRLFRMLHNELSHGLLVDFIMLDSFFVLVDVVFTNTHCVKNVSTNVQHTLIIIFKRVIFIFFILEV